MKLHITIPIEQYNLLISHSDMLGRIAAVVGRYANTPTTTTYECVVKLNNRERKLNAKIQAHKNLGGKFLSYASEFPQRDGIPHNHTKP